MSFRPQHEPKPYPRPKDWLCSRCDTPTWQHASKRAPNPEYRRQYDKNHPKPLQRDRIIGIDGEGQGRQPHHYWLLSAADENGKEWELVDPKRKSLHTVDCFEFLLSLPHRALLFSFAFNYDLTKILADVDDRTLYYLFREEKRVRVIHNSDGRPVEFRTRPMRWKSGKTEYHLQYINRCFTVKNLGTGRAATIWDTFTFFQTRFTRTLIDWKIADKSRLEEMEYMKEQRARFDELDETRIRQYCLEECVYLAKLGRQLIDMHEEIGLHLKKFYGAGSTASALLKKMQVNKYRDAGPHEMRHGIACAFFGGRFETSVVGPVPTKVYGYDISSAYPYQATLLPCLLCGRWRHVKGKRLETEIHDSTLALIHWTIGPIIRGHWGPLPVRTEKGYIVFPLSSQGGWTWKKEFLSAQRLNPHVEATEAWIYRTECDHRPFSELPVYYRERVRVGKSAKGKVLKLGPNGVTGKLAQSKSPQPPYQNWIWSGNIMSGTRAQLLDAIASASDKSSILMVATDGIWSTERLTLDKPVDTGTSDLPKPLGGWEEEEFDRGVFCVRPGIYFPLDPTPQQLDAVRARGLGKKILYHCWRRVIDAWDSGQKGITIKGTQDFKLERFCGVKSSISFTKADGYKRSPRYGEWVPHEVTVSFSPLPKRQAITDGGQLVPWERMGESLPYDNALENPEARALRLAQQIAEEQPDIDFVGEGDEWL